nr:collagen alpha-1(I) chain-like isoform X3 [Chelonoidis abingdonii]
MLGSCAVLLLGGPGPWPSPAPWGEIRPCSDLNPAGRTLWEPGRRRERRGWEWGGKRERDPKDLPKEQAEQRGDPPQGTGGAGWRSSLGNRQSRRETLPGEQAERGRDPPPATVRAVERPSQGNRWSRREIHPRELSEQEGDPPWGTGGAGGETIPWNSQSRGETLPGEKVEQGEDPPWGTVGAGGRPSLGNRQSSGGRPSPATVRAEERPSPGNRRSRRETLPGEQAEQEGVQGCVCFINTPDAALGQLLSQPSLSRLMTVQSPFFLGSWDSSFPVTEALSDWYELPLCVRSWRQPVWGGRRQHSVPQFD